MKEIILIIAEIINTMHDVILELTFFLGLDVTDKDLHLWIFGFLGICIFGCTHVFFNYLSKYGLTAISFVYTLTVMVVIVFAIEIQQQLTGRGQMEFDDAVIGLWGFLLFFAAFLIIKGIIKGIQYLANRKRRKTNDLEFHEK
jgi:small-conductance mechanosensitive channel